MQVQIVRAPTRPKVLNEARRLLGPDPLVLSVRRTPSAAGAGFEWEAVVARETPETTVPMVASLPEPSPEPAVVLGAPEGTRAVAEVDELRRGLERFRVADACAEASTQDLLNLARRVSQLESETLGSLLSGKELSKTWRPLLERLASSGYPKAEALRILCEVDRSFPTDEPTPWNHFYRRLRATIASQVAVATAEERVRPGLVVFTGSSGVGKTTLAAKLAADLCLGGSRKPVLGVLMPRKGLGLETLRRAARTMDVEFATVSDAEGLAQMAERAEHGPVILDSTSINPFHEASLRELRQILQAAPTAEVHVVVPASHSLEDFAVATQAFGFSGARRLSVTKLDESPYVGRVLAAASASRLPVGYVSQGPRIPDDLVRPALESLLDAVLRPQGGLSS